jgi:hypothetical protein
VTAAARIRVLPAILNRADLSFDEAIVTRSTAGAQNTLPGVAGALPAKRLIARCCCTSTRTT